MHIYRGHKAYIIRKVSTLIRVKQSPGVQRCWPIRDRLVMINGIAMKGK